MSSKQGTGYRLFKTTYKDARGHRKEAAKWYARAAEQGHAGAQNELGVMYLRGDGVYRNTGEAAKWFRLAARQGDETAIANLKALGIQPSGLLYRCPSCGRTTRVERRPAVSFSCPTCPWSDMQYVGPAY